MREMQLTARLQAIADLVPECDLLADVGTDHARLPIWLIKQGRVKHVIASDLRKGPLEQAARNLEIYHIESGIELRQCPGLEGISPDEVEAVTICGMGGETIRGILEDAPWTVDKYLILQPQSNQHILRRFLQENGYFIWRETPCEDKGYYYVILDVEAGHMQPLTPGEAWGGREIAMAENPCWLPFYTQLTGRMERELSFLEKSVQPKDFARRDDMRAALEELNARKEKLK